MWLYHTLKIRFFLRQRESGYKENIANILRTDNSHAENLGSHIAVGRHSDTKKWRKVIRIRCLSLIHYFVIF